MVTLLWDFVHLVDQSPLFPKLVMYIDQSRQLLYKFLLTRVASGQLLLGHCLVPISFGNKYALARRALRRAYRLRRCMTQLDIFPGMRNAFTLWQDIQGAY